MSMDRTRGIGGSDVGAILGVNRWKSGYDVWQDKMGVSEDVPDNAAMEWGRRLEEPVAQAFAQAVGADSLEEPAYYANPKYSWLGGHADRLYTLNGARGVLEVKTAGSHVASSWGESGATFESPTQAWTHVPESYLCQLAYYQAVFERPVGGVAVLIGGRDFRYYLIQRDRAFEDDLLSRLDHWWTTYVLGQTPPPIQSSEEADQQFPDVDDDADTLKPDDDVLADIDRLRAVKERLAELTAEKKGLEGRIKGGLGEAPAMQDHQGKIAVSWRARTARRLDQKLLRERHPDAASDCTVETTYRVLRVSKG